MIFSKEEQEFIRKHVKGKTVQELTKLINIVFNEDHEVNQIRNFKKKNKLRSEVDSKFKKNQVPHNKKNIGYEFINSDGYTEIKVAEPNKWMLKQRYLYQKYKGQIPKNHDVIFADGNKQNFDLENLILVERRDKLVMKNKHLFYKNRESTECGILIAKIINKTYDKRRKYEKN